MDKRDTKKPDDFLDLLMQNQMRIYAYILSMVRNYHDADDILQETAKIMFEKYADSRPINNFVGWAIQIANFKIMEYRKKKANAHIHYDKELFEMFASMVRDEVQRPDSRLEKLTKCLKKLTPRSRKLVELRYYQDLKPRQISSLLGLSITNVYKSMTRIHSQLLDCVRNS